MTWRPIRTQTMAKVPVRQDPGFSPANAGSVDQASLPGSLWAAQTWGGNTNELDTAIHLARVCGDVQEVTRLEQDLALVRAACSHVPHTGKPQCVLCGQPSQVPGRAAGPGIAKVQVPKYELPGRTGT